MNQEIAILREAVVTVTQLLAGKRLQVTQRGSRAYVATNPKTLKPERVNIPYIPDNATEGLILAIQGFIDHEVGHILHTDFKWNKKAQDEGEKMRSYWNIFEDTFIERKQIETFKGSGWNLKKLHEFFVAEITEPAFKMAEAKGDAATMFGIMMVPIARAWSGQTVFKDYLDAKGIWSHPALKGKIDRIRPIEAKVAGLASSKDCYDLAHELAELLKAPPAPKPPEPEPEPEEEPDDEAGEPNGGKGNTPEDEGEGPAEDDTPPEKLDDPDEKGSSGDDDEDGRFDKKGDSDKDPLSKLERRVLTARIDRKKTWDDIARKAKLSADEVEQIYDRAMQKLKTGFGEAA
ncbi:sigma factor-like helix-turn-helix DNA-binding protein [Methylobacterium sp. AMS5]|uniref:sigma factor-like helix-turn-helix DNA-binding protein n=1 Tax=Methylobacterium sp. AMS5 TaxID=925818 RepID=UPI00074F8337|nr:sigma factor-like helix-turn-helix DNA-binding protein [Methylobacterium sp. AMS5]AMB48382.1 hypothetical protein Y590_25775 [Methylobacterium sp. AMS5]